jgi:hypothetical protein
MAMLKDDVLQSKKCQQMFSENKLHACVTFSSILTLREVGSAGKIKVVFTLSTTKEYVLSLAPWVLQQS